MVDNNMFEKSLHERIAEKLGWSTDQVESFSLLTLRDMMKSMSHLKLAHEITMTVEGGSFISSRYEPARNRVAFNGREGNMNLDILHKTEKLGFNEDDEENEEAIIDSQFVDDADDQNEDDDDDEIEWQYDGSGFLIESIATVGQTNNNGFKAILNRKMKYGSW